MSAEKRGEPASQPPSAGRVETKLEVLVIPVSDVDRAKRFSTELPRETENHHSEYEPTVPKHHWSGWYAAYIVARERGRTPEEAARSRGSS